MWKERSCRQGQSGRGLHDPPVSTAGLQMDSKHSKTLELSKEPSTGAVTQQAEGPCDALAQNNPSLPTRVGTCPSQLGECSAVPAGKKQNKLFFPLPHLFLVRPLAARLEHEGMMTALCRAELSAVILAATQLPKALFFISFTQCLESFLGATLPLAYHFLLSPVISVVSDPLTSC